MQLMVCRRLGSRRRRRRRHLPPPHVLCLPSPPALRPQAVASFRQMEPLTDRLLRWLPEWVRDVAQDRRRQLLYWERQVQRRLLNEYRAQARELDPLLRARGRLVGESLLQVFVGGGGNGGGKGLSYADAVANSFPDNGASSLAAFGQGMA